jgi:hypothetical protein
MELLGHCLKDNKIAFQRVTGTAMSALKNNKVLSGCYVLRSYPMAINLLLRPQA